MKEEKCVRRAEWELFNYISLDKDIIKITTFKFYICEETFKAFGYLESACWKADEIDLMSNDWEVVEIKEKIKENGLCHWFKKCIENHDEYIFIGMEQPNCEIKFVCSCGDVINFKDIDDDVEVVCDCNKKYHIKIINLRNEYKCFFVKEEI